jgi:hypothetical protein
VTGNRWRWLYVLPVLWTGFLLWFWIGYYRPWYCSPDGFTCADYLSPIIIGLISLALVVLPFWIVKRLVRRLSSN